MSYPINLDIENKTCVVIGGGNIAFRKVSGLLNAGANVIVIAPNICDELEKLVLNKVIKYLPQKYIAGCLPSALILIAATDDPKVNEQAALEGAQKNMLVNIITKNDLNLNTKFTVPSVIRKDNLMLTISTNGNSPALSKRLRLYLEARWDNIFEEFLTKFKKECE